MTKWMLLTLIAGLAVCGLEAANAQAISKMSVHTTLAAGCGGCQHSCVIICRPGSVNCDRVCPQGYIAVSANQLNRIRLIASRPTTR